MPSLALATGAGAGDGLETLLGRMRAEEMLRRQGLAQDESFRHNKVQEDYQNRALDESSALRRDTMKATARVQAFTEDNRVRDDVREKEKLRVPGSKVSPEDYADVVHTGAVPMSSYQSRQDLAAETGRPDDQGPTEEPNTIFSGMRSTTAERRPPNSQVKTVTLDGKVVDADYNPGTAKYTYRGQDVTDRVGHYNAPDRTLVQSVDDKGNPVYLPRPEAAYKPVIPTSSTRTMQEGAKQLGRHINSVAVQAEALEQGGLFGPMMSRIRNVATRLGTMQGLASGDLDAQQAALNALGMAIGSDPTLASDRLAGKFAASLGLLATGAGRVHGGARGGGSPQMLEHFTHLLSDAGTLPMFLGRLDALKEYMDSYAGGPDSPEAPFTPVSPQTPTPGGGAAPTDDVYQEYLRKTGGGANAPTKP